MLAAKLGLRKSLRISFRGLLEKGKIFLKHPVHAGKALKAQ